MSKQILLIGAGYLAQYLIPCYERAFGADLASCMRGIKGSELHLMERQEVFPFPLQVLGTGVALRQMQPEVVLMAAKPNQVPAIAEEILAPYWEECRAQGSRLADKDAGRGRAGVQYAAEHAAHDRGRAHGGGCDLVSVI